MLAYPYNFAYSDESSFSQPFSFTFDEVWSVPQDTLPAQTGLDEFGELPTFFSDDLSDVITDEEVANTPPPSSPLPETPSPTRDTLTPIFEVPHGPLLGVPVDYQSQYAAQSLQQSQLYLQYQHYQYQLLQQKLLMSTFQPPIQHFRQAAPTMMMPLHEPIYPSYPSYQEAVPSNLDTRSYEVPQGNNSLGTHLNFTNLDASHFGATPVTYPKLNSIPLDISGNLTDAQYSKIFKKYHYQLHLDSHPTFTEQDLEDIRVNGRMYFLKNVKTIVPKVGPWKFNAHISHRRSDERQYNIPGLAVTCKVKEWLTDDGLWRLYHYKKGKTVKVKKQ